MIAPRFASGSARLRVALAFLREPQRVLTVCLTVALGTVALILASGFIERTFSVFREAVIHAHTAHLQVLPASGDDRIDPGSGDRGGVRQRVERELATAHPGAIVAGRLSFAGLVGFGERTVGFLGEGVEPGNEAALSKAVRLSAGAQLSEADPAQVILGEGLARSLGAGVGDRITLLANLPRGGVNAVEVTVAGLFHTSTKAYDDRALRLPMASARRLTRLQGYSRLMVLLPETEAAATAAERLRTALADAPVKVKPWTELADFYNKTVELFRRQLGFVRGVILALVLLTVFNAMARSVMERQREIGTMMALGARRAAVARRFVGEALVTGALGGAAGVLLGAGIAWLVNRIGIPMPPPPGTAHGFTGGIEFSGGGAVVAFVSVLTVCAVASLGPALRAARLNPVDALRAER